MINYRKIILGQIYVEASRPDLNIQRILNFLAKLEKGNLVLFPELCISGKMIGDLFLEDSFVKKCKLQNEKILKISKEKNLIIIWGNIDFDEKKKNEDETLRKYNAIYLAYNGKIIKTQYKTLLTNHQMFDEKRYFTSLENFALEQRKNLQDYFEPIALDFDGKNTKVSLLFGEEICNLEKNYFVNPLKFIKNYNPDLVLVFGAFPFIINKTKKLNSILKHQSIKSNLFYINPIGIQNNGKNLYTFDGFSAIYSNGKFIKGIKNFSENKETKKLEIKGEIEQIYELIIFSIKNFFNQIGAKKILIGLSGGIDSGLGATLLKIALGKEKIIAVNMPSKFNSSITKKLAKSLASNLQIKYLISPIDDAVNQSIKDIKNTTGKDPTDFQIENIQARERGKRLSDLAAVYDAVYVCNANKDELLTGYSTLYGDINGCLAILGDLTKTQIIKLAGYINKKFKKKIIPKEMIDLKPSAELSEKQKPEKGFGDPFDYEFLGKLNEAIILKNKSKDDLIELIEKNKLEKFLGLKKIHFSKKEDLINEIERIYLLKKKSIFKRIQSPPILSLTGKSFGNDYREGMSKL